MSENRQGFSVVLTDIFGYKQNRSFESEAQAIAYAQKRFGFENFFTEISVINSATGGVCYHDARCW